MIRSVIRFFRKSTGKATAKPTNRRQPPKKRSEPKWDASKFNVPAEPGKTRFHDLHLPNAVMHAIADLDFRYCTPIQAEVLHKTLKGADAFGQAQTGTGKTAAFLITILSFILKNKLHNKRNNGQPRALIIAPTRELVIQITRDANSLAKYCNVNIVSVFGGMDYQRQRKQLLGDRVDIVVATPGRLLDFKRNREISLNKVEILVIDEADRMLDMGFIPDVRRIVRSLPEKEHRQTLLFSATLTNDVKYLGSSWTTDPHVVEIEPEQVAVDTVDQKVFIVTTEQKFALLYNIIIKQKLERVIIFCNRRDQSRDLVDRLKAYGMLCELLSGDVQQRKRMKVLDGFKDGITHIMVATDVAGRGIHIDGLDHVINYTLPQDPEDYVHRIGRTGRAGKDGTSISFACENDSHYIPAIEELIGNELNCTYPDDDMLAEPPKVVIKRSASRADNQRSPRSDKSRSSHSRGKSQGHKSSRRRSI